MSATPHEDARWDAMNKSRREIMLNRIARTNFAALANEELFGLAAYLPATSFRADEEWPKADEPAPPLATGAATGPLVDALKKITHMSWAYPANAPTFDRDKIEHYVGLVTTMQMIACQALVAHGDVSGAAPVVPTPAPREANCEHCGGEMCILEDGDGEPECVWCNDADKPGLRAALLTPQAAPPTPESEFDPLCIHCNRRKIEHGFAGQCFRTSTDQPRTSFSPPPATTPPAPTGCNCCPCSAALTQQLADATRTAKYESDVAQQATDAMTIADAETSRLRQALEQIVAQETGFEEGVDIAAAALRGSPANG